MIGFITSSYCKADQDMCVAVRPESDAPAVGDTKPDADGILELNRESFTALLETLR